MLLEEGKPVVGKWEVVTADIEEAKKIKIQPGRVYQYEWDVETRIPLPPFISDLRKKILAYVAKLQQEIRGLKVIWWKITDDKLVMQVVKEGETVAQAGMVEEVSLGLVAVLASGVFFAAGIYLVFKLVKVLVEKFKEEAEKYPWIAGLFVVGIILGSVYIISKEFAPKRE